MVGIVAVLTALNISKEAWEKIPEEDKQRIKKAVVEGNIALAKKMLAATGVIKTARSGNPTKEKENFKPIEKACADAFDKGWLGDKHWNIEKFGVICQRRGLIGAEVWTQNNLSLPLELFEKESRNMDSGKYRTIEDRISALLTDFAKIIKFDPNLVKQHFYAVRFNYADQFLADIEKQEKKREKLEEFAEEAESEGFEVPEFAEEEEGEEE